MKKEDTLKIPRHDGTRESVTILFILILTVTMVIGFLL
jgi:hypothetical protein